MDKVEAIRILKDFHDKSGFFSVRTALETLHPEIAKSEDEKIRKFLIQMAQNIIQMAQNNHGGNKEWWDKCVAWLERQGEQKSAWSDEQIKAIIESLKHKWSLGDSAEAKYKVEAYDELMEMLKEEKS